MNEVMNPFLSEKTFDLIWAIAVLEYIRALEVIPSRSSSTSKNIFPGE